MNFSNQLNKVYVVILIFIFCNQQVRGQEVAIKTNLAYWATTTPNLGMEFALGKKSTLEISGGFNPFEFSDNKRFKHWLVQPEYRWWFCETFNGHFLGVHAHGAQFNVGGWDIPIGRLDVFKDKRYEGYLYGGGLSYGYQWVLSNRWNFEFNIGAGYARIHYNEYPCKDCGTKQDEGNYNFWGVTKAELSFIYIIK
ncbi:DUF3575 domain-containing protein [Dysgonomonas sp. Marseille-P4361]|uniref:DUF3575 domain-containing protein n=1 Tax=Dysgonomonas sp. Marseille-P4361 TaxID=2161820 RepID=UPI000D55E670|nr:DUF3575 domain-containing protein [Dysgonomonas sp. Marseille-P4361]